MGELAAGDLAAVDLDGPHIALGVLSILSVASCTFVLMMWARRETRGLIGRPLGSRPGRILLAVMAVWSATDAVLFALSGKWWLVARNIYEGAVAAFLWWKCGGGDSTRRMVERGTGWVRRQGNRLVVAVPVRV